MIAKYQRFRVAWRSLDPGGTSVRRTGLSRCRMGTTVLAGRSFVSCRVADVCSSPTSRTGAVRVRCGHPDLAAICTQGTCVFPPRVQVIANESPGLVDLGTLAQYLGG